MDEYTFLIISRSPCCDLKTVAKVLPKETAISDGDLTIYWTTKAKSLKSAITKVITYINKIIIKSELDWVLDEEYDYREENSVKSETLEIDVDGTVNTLLKKAGLR